MIKLLWMTIDRHPESLKALIRNQLSDAGWEVYEVSYDSIDSLESVPLESIDAVLLAPARHFPVRYMDRLTSCRLMQIWSSGYDKFNVEDAQVRKIPVANNHGSNAVSVAEHTILMMLGVSRRAPEMHDRVVQGRWAGNDHGMSSFSLAGKTLGLVGLGNIGTLVANRAEALGMKIVYNDPKPKMDARKSWVRKGYTPLLQTSDYISFHLHLTKETRGMLGATELGALKQKPFIINASRAELIEKEALIRALEAGRLRGVAMDAHYEEPTNASDPLFALAGTFFSPHVAGSTVDSYTETLTSCLTNIVAALEEAEIAGRIVTNQRP